MAYEKKCKDIWCGVKSWYLSVKSTTSCRSMYVSLWICVEDLSLCLLLTEFDLGGLSIIDHDMIQFR